MPKTGTARDAGQSVDVYSYVLTFSGGNVQVAAEGIPYYLNAVHLGQRGKVLLGQKRGEQGPGSLLGRHIRDAASRQRACPGPEVSTPPGANMNVFNFAKADINNNQVDEFIQVDDHFTPHILDASGKQVWIGDGVWGATTNSFESKSEERLWRKATCYAIPSPILIADLRHNGTPEIVVNRNTASSENWLANSRKYCNLGEIVGLSWGHKGLTEKLEGKGVKRAGYVASYRKPRQLRSKSNWWSE